MPTMLRGGADIGGDLANPVCLGAVPEDVRVRALAAGRADEDAVSLVPGSFEIEYVAKDGSAHRVALTPTASTLVTSPVSNATI